jgi:hypothetical protein
MSRTLGIEQMEPRQMFSGGPIDLSVSQETISGAQAAVATINLNGPASVAAVSVYYSLTGNASDYSLSLTSPSDASLYQYSGNVGAVVIPYGESAATVTIQDANSSGSENGTLTLFGASGGTYEIDSASSAATVTLGDSGSSGGTPAVSVDSGSSGTFTIDASGGSGEPLNIDYSLSGPSSGYELYVFPNAGASYSQYNEGTLTLPAGASQATVSIIDPSNVSASESVTLELENDSGASYTINSPSATVTIGGEPVVFASGGNDGTVTIDALRTTGDSMAVDVSLAGSTTGYELLVTPNTGSSYTLNSQDTLTLPAGATQATVTILNPEASGSESVTLSLSPVSGASYTLGNSAATATIGGEPVLSLGLSSTPTVTIDASSASDEPLNVGFSLSGPLSEYGVLVYDGTGLVSAEVTGTGSNFVTIPSGDSQVSVAIVDLDDPTDSASVSFSLVSASDGSYNIDSIQSSATVTLDAIESAPSGSVSLPTVSVETDGATVTIELSQPASQGLEVDYSLSGTASEYLVNVAFGSGYQPEQWDASYGAVVFPAGATQATLQIADPLGASGSEAVSFQLLSPADSSYNVSSNASASSATISIEGGTGFASGGSGGTPVVSIHASGAAATIDLSSPASQSVTINYTIDGSASEYDVTVADGAGVYSEQMVGSSGTITIPTGDSSVVLTFVDPNDGSDSEGISIALQSSSLNSYSIEEGDGSASVTINGSGMQFVAAPSGQNGNPPDAQLQFSVITSVRIQGGVLTYNYSGRAPVGTWTVTIAGAQGTPQTVRITPPGGSFLLIPNDQFSQNTGMPPGVYHSN